jgi:hypothetical protein
MMGWPRSSLKSAWLVRLLLVPTLGLAGCDDDTDPVSTLAVEPRAVNGCEGEYFSACNIYDPSCQRAVFETTACLWGAKGQPQPQVRFITAEEYRQEIRSYQQTVDPDTTLAQVQGRSLALLNLGNPTDFLPADMENLIISTVPAYYSAGLVTFIEPEVATPERSFGQLTVLMSHEFTHSLQGTTINWAEVGPPAATYDANLAAISVTEGTAEVTAGLYSAGMWGLNPKRVDFAGHLTAWLPAVEAALNGQSVLLGSYRYFPYTYGAKYTYDIYTAGGTTALRALFKPLPASTHPILFFAQDGETLISNPLPAEPPLPPQDYELTQGDTLGAWVLRKFVGRLDNGTEHSERLARAWRHDQFFSFRRGLDDVATVWRLRLADAAAATDLAELVKATVRSVRLADSDAGLEQDSLLPASAMARGLRTVTQTGSDLTFVLSEDDARAGDWAAAFDAADAGAPPLSDASASGQTTNSANPSADAGTAAQTVDAGSASQPLDAGARAAAANAAAVAPARVPSGTATAQQPALGSPRRLLFPRAHYCGAHAGQYRH